MKDFYRALGFPGVVTHLPTLERALGEGRLPSVAMEDARFVLLDPIRKARYDELLARAVELSDARIRLGLPKDPHLPGTVPQGTVDSAGEPGPWPFRTASAGLVGMLLLLALVWAGFRSDLQPPSLGAGSAAVGAGPQGGEASAGPPEGESDAVPPPGHGWLRMSPDIHPCVPWHIETEPGRDYELSLHMAGSGAMALTVYLRGGEPYRGLAPEGTFELSFSSGTRWLGPGRGFAGAGAGIRATHAYRVQAGPDDAWVWNLRLHPRGCEGSPVAPERPSAPPLPPGGGPMPLAAPEGGLL